MAPLTSEISQSFSKKSESTSTVEQKSSQQSHSYKLEHKTPEIPLPKPIERKTPTFEKRTDYQISHEFIPGENKEVIEEKKTVIEEGGIETSSISKESSLQYFVKKIKEGDAAPATKEVPVEPIRPLKPEIFQKFSTVESELKKESAPSMKAPTVSTFTEIRTIDNKSTAPVTQEFRSVSSTKEVTREVKTVPFTQEYKSSPSTTEKTSHPFTEEFRKETTKTQPATKPFTQEYSSFSSRQQISEPHEYKTYSSEVIREVDLKPEPPAEICFPPANQSTFKHDSVQERVHKLSTSSKELPAHEVPQGGVKIFPSPQPAKTAESFSERKEFSEKVEKSYQSSSYQTSSSSYSKSFESSSSPAFTGRKTPEVPPVQKMWSTKHELLDRPASVASSSYSTERHSYSRPLSAMSGEPSTEALHMEKQWAHKFMETQTDKPWTRPQSAEPKPTSSWSTQSTLEKKWAPVEMKSERIVQESRTFLDKTPVLVPHYIGEVTRLETTVKDQTSDSYSSSKSEHIVEESNLKPSLKSWPPGPPVQEYVPPPPRPYPNIDSIRVRPVSVQDITDEVYLEPGPPPEIGYAEPPKGRRRSYVETIEHDLKQELQREPSKVPPCAVRTIPPPPLPPKKEIPQAPPVPARPVKLVETKPKKPLKELPYVPFEKFPDLEPFPFTPDPERPRPPRTGPPPTPSRFVKGRFTDSDYESDFENVRIPPKWKPSMSDTEEPRYRRVRAPLLVSTGRSRSQEPEPLPPSKFDRPPQFHGPPRPEVDFEEFRRKKDASQIKKMTKHFEQVRREVSPPKIKPASPPTYVYPEKRPESPKVKKKVVIDGYMADTDEPFQQRLVKTEHFREEKTESRHISQSSQKIYESSSSTQKTFGPKTRVCKYPVKKHQSSVSSVKKVRLNVVCQK